MPLQCPRCTSEDTHVFRTRRLDNGASVQRRTECLACGHRFTSLETYQLEPRVRSEPDRYNLARQMLQEGRPLAEIKATARVGGDTLMRLKKELDCSSI